MTYCDKRSGYGRFWLKNRYINAHKFAYIVTFGQIEKNTCVCHTCDNPSCCNPYHLFPGSYSDNNKDRAIKNRSACGIKQGSSVISDDNLTLIIKRLDIGYYQNTRDAVKNFNINQRHLHHILTGRQKRKNLNYTQEKLNEIFQRTKSSLNLTPDHIIDEIIQKILSGSLTNRSQIAKQYGINQGTLSNILCQNIKRKNIKSTSSEITQAQTLLNNNPS